VCTFAFTCTLTPLHSPHSPGPHTPLLIHPATATTRPALAYPALPCLQACGFYPQVGRLLPRPPNDQKARTSVLTRKDERVRIHPASTNAK